MQQKKLYNYTPPQFQSIQVEPDRLLTDLLHVTCQCNHSVVYPFHNIVKPDTYLNWAKTDIQGSDDRGFSNCVVNCNRAVLRCLDELLYCNNLDKFIGRKNPEKLDALRQIGFPTHGILYSDVIGVRNEHEHEYEIATEGQSRRAIELAELFLRATDDPLKFMKISRGRMVLFGDDVLTAQSSGPDGWAVEIGSSPQNPLMLIDCINDKYRIVDFQLKEMRWAFFKDATPEQVIQIAKWCSVAKRRDGGSDIGFIPAWLTALSLPA